MKLAVVLPSRGLVYSKTVEELYRELDSLDGSFSVFWAHGRPIPECFNEPTEKALETDPDYVLFVEEDMVLPEGILGRMLARIKHAISVDYPVGGGHGGTVMYDPDMVPFFTGTGLLLVRGDILTRLPKPIWRTDIEWKPYVEDGLIHFTLKVKKDREIYGQHDVAFGLRLYANGYPIELLPETVGQREMVKRGGRGANDAFHEVVERMKVVPRTDLTHLPSRQIFEEILIDGKRVKVKQETLARLGDVERPDYIRSGRGIFDAPDEIKQWLIMN